jgi:hypothetical protein
MSVLQVHVYDACPCSCRLSVSMLHVHVNATFLSPCSFSMSMLHVQVHTVPDLGKGVCADPVNGGAILGKGGPDPQGGNKERQLSPGKREDVIG